MTTGFTGTLIPDASGSILAEEFSALSAPFFFSPWATPLAPADLPDGRRVSGVPEWSGFDAPLEARSTSPVIALINSGLHRRQCRQLAAVGKTPQSGVRFSSVSPLSLRGLPDPLLPVLGCLWR